MDLADPVWKNSLSLFTPPRKKNCDSAYVWFLPHLFPPPLFFGKMGMSFQSTMDLNFQEEEEAAAKKSGGVETFFLGSIKKKKNLWKKEKKDLSNGKIPLLWKRKKKGDNISEFKEPIFTVEKWHVS